VEGYVNSGLKEGPFGAPVRGGAPIKSCVVLSVLACTVLAVRLLTERASNVTVGAVKRSVVAGVEKMPVTFVMLDVTKASRTRAVPVIKVPPRLSMVALDAVKVDRLFATIELVTVRLSTAKEAVMKLTA
jgi:hypothetical protein